MEQNDNFEMWCVLELFGHRRMAGIVSEQTIAGASFIRIDVPETDEEDKEGWFTQLYNPSAVYAISPTSEEQARKVAQRAHYRPIQEYEVRPTQEALPVVGRGWPLDHDEPDETSAEDEY